MDRAYDAANDISIIDNTLYIAGTKLGRARGWYYNITKAPTLGNGVPVNNQY